MSQWGALQERHFSVEVHEEKGSLWAEVPDLPGCFVSADTIPELEESLAEAISLYLSDDTVTVQVHHLVLQQHGSDGTKQTYRAELVPA